MAEALKLDPDEQAALIAALADTVLSAPVLHPDWDREIARRVAEMDAGRSSFVPAEEAMAALAARIRARRPAT